METVRLNRVVRSILYLLRINKINDAQKRNILLEALETLPKIYCNSCIYYEKCKGKNKKLRKNTVACLKYEKNKKYIITDKNRCGNCSLFDICKKERSKIRKNSLACMKYNKINKNETLSENEKHIIEHINQIENNSEFFESDTEKCILGTNIRKPNIQMIKNAFTLVGTIRRALRTRKCPPHIIQKYSDDVKNANFNELIKISKKYINFI